jgi:glycerol kinase
LPANNLLAIDQGTTGTTVLVVGPRGDIRGKATREFPQIFPEPGWVEHRPDDIWSSVLSAVREALKSAGLRRERITAIGVANQRETTLLWERRTGKPLGNAIVWQDRRTAGLCGALKRRGLDPVVRIRSGLRLDPYFSGTKIRWLLDQSRSLRRRAESGDIAFGTMDSVLLHRLTGGAVHATDATNASRTLLMNLRSLRWDPVLCRALRVPEAMLPDIRPTIGIFGRTRGVSFVPDGVPITAMAGDQQAALFGQACFRPGEAKCTFGTGSFLLINTGRRPLISRSGCLPTVAWSWNGGVHYALEGSAFVCGAAVQWLRDGLGILRRSSDVEALASAVPDAAGVEFVPAFAGMGAPRWKPLARGLLCGLTRGTTKAHIARSVLEGLALQNVELLRAMERDLGRRVVVMKVDGGASANNLLMSLQADYSGARCVRPRIVETTAMGAAFMAGLGAGVWKNLEDVRALWRKDREFRPVLSRRRREMRLERWKRAARRAEP